MVVVIIRLKLLLMLFFGIFLSWLILSCRCIVSARVCMLFLFYRFEGKGKKVGLGLVVLGPGRLIVWADVVFVKWGKGKRRVLDTGLGRPG